MEGIIQRISRIAPIRSRQAAPVVNPERERILTELRETTRELAAVRSCFDLETNFDLIDAYILQMDSLEKRYGYWLKRAKREKIAAF